MKMEELREILSEFPDDIEVFITAQNEHEDMETFEIDGIYYHGDGNKILELYAGELISG